MSATNPPTDNRQAWRRGDRENLLRAGGLMIAALVFSAVATAGVLAAKWGLVTLGVLGAGAFFYLLISDEQLVNRAIVLLTTAIVVLLGLTLGLWLVVNFYWAGQDAEVTIARSAEPIVYEQDAFRAELEYAPAAPQGDPGRVATLALIPTTATTLAHTITAEFELPPGLRLESLVGEPITALSFEVGPEGELRPRRARLANDGTSPGARAREELVVRFAGADAGQLRAPVIVEGDWGFTVRRFVTSTVNENGPLVFVGLLLFPVAASLAQRWLEERRTQTEQWRQQEFRRARDAFRENFQAEDLAGARAEQEALRRIPDPTREIEAEIELADGLLHVVRLGETLPPPDIEAPPLPDYKIKLVTIKTRWPEGLAIAFLIVLRVYKERGLPPHHQTLYNDIRKVLSYHEFADDPELRDRLAQAYLEEITDNPNVPLLHVQGRKWPLPVACDGNKPTDPLAGDDAAFSRERCFLVNGEGFDGRHALFNKKLWRKPGSHLVYGSPGSGRTAFAAMLVAKGEERKLTVLLDGRSTADFWFGPARQLCEFVLSHPTHLNGLRSARLQQLGILMATALGSPVLAAASIERAQATLPALPDLAGQERQEQRRLAGDMLQLLLKVLPAAATGQSYSTPGLGQSPGLGDDLRVCMHAFGFERVVYVVDLPPEPQIAQDFRQAVFPSLSVWEASGADFVVFAPHALGPELADAPRVMERHSLTWSRPDLERLIRTRYQAVFVRPASPVDRFDPPDGLTTMIDHSKLDGELYNPRRFFRLWREAVAVARADNEEKIKEAHIARAIEAMEGTNA